MQNASTYIRNERGDVVIPDGDPPLYRHYVSQLEPQEAYLAIHLDEDVAEWDYNGEVGDGVPQDVWNGVVYRIPCSPYLGEEHLDSLTQKLRPLIERVWDGGRVKRDTNHNRIGTLTDEGQDAADEIARILADEAPDQRSGDFPGGEWELGDWIHTRRDDTHVYILPDIVLTATTTDDELEEAEARLDAEARRVGIILVDTWESLARMRDHVALTTAEAE